MTDVDSFEDTGFFDKVLYKLLSKVGGEDLKKQKQREIRRKRKQFIEETGRPPFNSVMAIEVLVELGLQEAQLVDGFDPDLLVVSPAQFKSLFNISIAVALNPDDWADTLDQMVPGREKEKVASCQQKRFGDYHIDVVYSSTIDRMLLVDSSGLTDEVVL